MEDGDEIRVLLQNALNPIWAAKKRRWDLVVNGIRADQLSTSLDAFILLVAAYKDAVIRNDMKSFEELFSYINAVLSNDLFMTGDKTDKIIEILVRGMRYGQLWENDYQKMVVIQNTMSLIGRVMLRRGTDSTEGVKALIDIYISDISSTVNYVPLLNSIILNQEWQPSTDKNSFLQDLINNYINLSGEKKEQIGIWINHTIENTNFRPSVGNNFILLHMLRQSVKAYLGERDEVSETINGWIHKCVSLDSFIVSDENDQYVDALLDAYEMFMDASVNLKMRPFLIYQIKGVLAKNPVQNTRLESKFKAWWNGFISSVVPGPYYK